VGEKKLHVDFHNLWAAMFHCLERFHLAQRYVLAAMMVHQLLMQIQMLPLRQLSLRLQKN
jgi:hypothetical protein